MDQPISITQSAGEPVFGVHYTTKLAPERSAQVFAERPVYRKRKRKATLRRAARWLVVEAAGIAPASRLTQPTSLPCLYGDGRRCWLEMGWEDASLKELLDKWPGLPPHIVHAIMALVRASQA
jgi:hypothetical protein